VFDNQFLAAAILRGVTIGEISCPTKYFADASSINFPRSVRYGLGVLSTSLAGFFARTGIFRARFLRDR
jgi:hypothetical protein